MAQNSNASAASAGSSDSVKPADPGSGSPGAGHSGNGEVGSNNDPFAAASATNAANATGMALSAPADASRHTTVESLAPPAPDPNAGAGASKPASPAPFSAQQSSLPASLPTSLGDVVQASRLYQRVGGAEMHIAMDTDFLGSIDLRAVVHQSALTATIGVQHADVQALLSSELPGLQHALSQKNLHVEQISIFGSGVGSQSSQGEGQQRQNAAPFMPQVPAPFSANSGGAQEPAAAAGDSAAVGNDAGRLSIHV